MDPETGVLSAAVGGQGYDWKVQLTLLEDGTLLAVGSAFGIEIIRMIYYRLGAE